jgi:hypothetical protein
MLIPLGVFAAVLLLVFGAYWIFVLQPEQQGERAVLGRLKTSRARPAMRLLKARENLSSVGSLDALLTHWSAVSVPLQNLITRSGMKITVGVLVTSCVFVGLFTGSMVAWLTRYALPVRSLQGQ